VLCGAVPARGRCYDTRAAPGSGACREARDGACVQYAEEVMRHDEPGSKVAELTTCQAAASGPGNCKTAMCNVWIGGKDYCSKCAETAELLIDGTCVTSTTELAKKCTTNTKGACLSCGDGYFLYSNGCYAIGGTPGSNICADPTPSEGSSGTAGKCAICATGYFKNPADVAAGTPPCIACNDTAGFTVSSGPTYKGIADCTVCTAPEAGSSGEQKAAKCTKCGNSKYLKSDGSGCVDNASRCASGTEFAKEDAANGNKCVSCGDQTDGVAGCNTCTYDSSTKKVTCTECTDKYLKAVDGTTTCVTKGDCNGGYFPNDSVDSKKQCILCNKATTGGIDGCTECALLSSPSRAVLITCSACVSGKKPNTSGSQCIACDIDGCARCSEASKCSQCGDSYRLEGDTCVRTGGNLSTGAITGISVTKSSPALRC
ncbi:Variant-specific surface protein, partial [Giardia duodenalis]